MTMDEVNIDFSRLDTPREKDKRGRKSKGRSRYYNARRAYWKRHYPELDKIENEGDKAYILNFIADTGVRVKPKSAKSREEKALIEGKIEVFFYKVRSYEKDGYTRKESLNMVANDLRITCLKYDVVRGNIYYIGSP